VIVRDVVPGARALRLAPSPAVSAAPAKPEQARPSPAQSCARNPTSFVARCGQQELTAPLLLCHAGERAGHAMAAVRKGRHAQLRRERPLASPPYGSGTRTRQRRRSGAGRPPDLSDSYKWRRRAGLSGPTARAARHRERNGGAPTSVATLVHKHDRGPSATLDPVGLAAAIAQTQQCCPAEPRGSATMAFRESDRPNGPRAGDTYGDEAHARPRVVLAETAYAC
jgi:hypothetical protein